MFFSEGDSTKFHFIHGLIPSLLAGIRFYLITDSSCIHASVLHILHSSEWWVPYRSTYPKLSGQKDPSFIFWRFTRTLNCHYGFCCCSMNNVKWVLEMMLLDWVWTFLCFCAHWTRLCFDCNFLRIPRLKFAKNLIRYQGYRHHLQIYLSPHYKCWFSFFFLLSSTPSSTHCCQYFQFDLGPSIVLWWPSITTQYLVKVEDFSPFLRKIWLLVYLFLQFMFV